MVSVAYSEAAVEVLDILEHLKKEDVDKIPKNFINFLKENVSNTYKPNLNHTKKISDMELKPKTKAILGLMYVNYWANKEEKNNFLKKAKENEEKYTKEQIEKYSVDNLFKNHQEEKIQEINNENLPAKVKEESFIQKIINKIKKVLKIEK